MNRAQRRQQEREMRNNPYPQRKPFMSIPDLGEINARNKAKAETPPWTAGEPVFSLPVGVPASNNPVSFTEVIDRTARNLAIDGWEIIAVQSVQIVGAEEGPNGPVVGFQVAVRVKQVEPKSEDIDGDN